MTMLIKGGLIHTMTTKPAFVGDILVRSDRIEAVASWIDLPEESSSCVLDAKGLTIIPGLIDPYIQQGSETDVSILQGSQACGVTTGLLWPEDEGRCQAVSASGTKPAMIHKIVLRNYTDAQLHERVLTLAEDGYRPVCEVRSAAECRRVLQIVHSSRVKLILSHLHGCEEMLEAVALSGCPVIIGVSGTRCGKPWEMASKLTELGAKVALTCSYPNAKLRYLPLCAALCVRDGMDRESALHTVTTAPAAILGLSDAGRIEAGCQADLAIYDGDPLLLATSHIMTIEGGKIRH